MFHLYAIYRDKSYHFMSDHEKRTLGDIVMLFKVRYEKARFVISDKPPMKCGHSYVAHQHEFVEAYKKGEHFTLQLDAKLTWCSPNGEAKFEAA